MRACAGLSGWQLLQADPDAYARLAIGLANHGVFGFSSSAQITPTAFRPPLYPWLLSWLVSDSELLPAAVFVLHLALSLLLAALTYSIAAKLNLRWPVLAGLLVTVDPLLIRAGQQVMTELLATLLAVLAWWLWLTYWPNSDKNPMHCQTARRSVGQWAALYGLGMVFGLSILTRPTAAPWAVVCVACMWYGCACWKRRMGDMLVVSTGILLCVMPWTLRNLTNFGKPIWATTHGGYTLFLANNPLLYQHFIRNGPNRNWNAEPFHEAWAARGEVGRDKLMEQTHWRLTDTNNNDASLVHEGDAHDSNSSRGSQVHTAGELADDALAYDLALQTIKNDPRTFALSCFYRLCWLWAWWPSGAGTLATIAIGSWYGAILVLAVQGLSELLRGLFPSAKLSGFRNRMTALGRWMPGLALIVVLSVVHCVFWSNMRMRAPVMPCIYLSALASLARRNVKDESYKTA